jgi:hypothetical protein
MQKKAEFEDIEVGLKSQNSKSQIAGRTLEEPAEAKCRDETHFMLAIWEARCESWV